MKIPFPTISDVLAVRNHMYICIKEGQEKEFVKCQSLKPYHLRRGSQPIIRVIEVNDASRNPFKNKTIIDCDKKFEINGITIPTDLLCTIRPDVCNELFQDVVSSLSHSNLHNYVLPADEVAHINSRIGTI